MKVITLYILFFSLFIVFSCHTKKKENMSQLVTEWQGKKIIFPENIVFTRYLTDTTDYRIPDSEYKILIYVDSVGCTSCELQLSKWKELVAYTDSVTHGNIPFLFFIHSNDYREVRHLLEEDGFDIPICIDREDTLNKLNRFPSDASFRTFLLDRENKIVVIGNPVHNLAVKELYLKQIGGQSDSAAGQVKTEATADVTDIDMGAFEGLETKQAVFKIRNTGNKPLMIADVAVICGCAIVTHPASPGEALKVVVDMTPKDSGFFSETITVKTNTEEYIKLSIRGTGNNKTI
jgi:hypothetical protein